MLVLTRKPGEKIILGNHYQIEVATVQHGVVKFIFDVDQAVTLMPGNISVDVDGGDELSRIAITRKVDDSVVIGDDPASSIEVLVVSVKGEAVRVGIKAPREIQVHREEVWRLIQESNIEAAQAAELDAAQLEELLGPKRGGKGDSTDESAELGTASEELPEQT